MTLINIICGFIFIFFICRYAILEMDRSNRKKQFWDDIDTFNKKK